MGRKVKYNAEEKISAIKEYLDGKNSMSSIAKRLGIDPKLFKRWIQIIAAHDRPTIHNS